MKRYITSRHYDIDEGEIGRVFRFSLLNRVVPLGNVGGGATLKILLILFFLHRFARPLFRLVMPQEARLTRLYLKIRKPAAAGEQ